MSSEDEDDYDSLFDGSRHSSIDIPYTPDNPIPASRLAPSIPGLYYNPAVTIPVELENKLLKCILEDLDLFRGGTVDQIMLFSRTEAPNVDTSNNCRDCNCDTGRTANDSATHTSCCDASTDEPLASSPTSSSLPPFLLSLISELSGLLLPHLSDSSHALLFPSARSPSTKSYPSRQAILNLYHSGDGITPHVDLVNRFGDGIIGVTLGSGTVMEFTSVDKANTVTKELYLSSRSILVLEGEARYLWTHGIPRRSKDFVGFENGEGGEWIDRGVRISITLRWLLPGADIVGSD